MPENRSPEANARCWADVRDCSNVGLAVCYRSVRVQVSRDTIGCYGILRPLVRVRWVPLGIRKPILWTIALLVPANGMDAMGSIPLGRTIIGRTTIEKRRAPISILDSGSGIPPNKLEQIFDRFFTTKEQGMGVGLSIPRTIVRAHKGQIWAENQREGGAVFWNSLPLS
jgi:Histidine kinase-, DNA gyrase B-, and HSP90-like ATPase